MIIIYRILSFILLALSLFGAYKENVTFATIAFLSSSLLFIFSSIDNIQEFSAGLSGIKAKFKEVQNAIDEVKMVAKEMASISLDTLIKSGRMSAYTIRGKEKQKDNIISPLKSLKISEEEIKDTLDEWHRLRMFDHVLVLTNGSHILGGDLQKYNTKRTELIDKARITPLKPQEIKDFLVEIGKFDELSDFYEDYEFYYKNKTFRRMEIWEDSQKWHLLTHGRPKDLPKK